MTILISFAVAPYSRRVKINRFCPLMISLGSNFIQFLLVQFMNNNFDVVIIGGGMVGLCVAYQLIQSKKARKIVVVDKEKELGLHSSGRNSGVLHAGLYYKPNSIKAKVCVEGTRVSKNG